MVHGAAHHEHRPPPPTDQPEYVGVADAVDKEHEVVGPFAVKGNAQDFGCHGEIGKPATADTAAR